MKIPISTCKDHTLEALPPFISIECGITLRAGCWGTARHRPDFAGVAAAAAAGMAQQEGTWHLAAHIGRAPAAAGAATPLGRQHQAACSAFGAAAAQPHTQCRVAAVAAAAGAGMAALLDKRCQAPAAAAAAVAASVAGGLRGKRSQGAWAAAAAASAASAAAQDAAAVVAARPQSWAASCHEASGSAHQNTHTHTCIHVAR
eukprot:1156520-Pelagomonas_calceolata.AAC.11